jgi:hypothetical protein
MVTSEVIKVDPAALSAAGTTIGNTQHDLGAVAAALRSTFEYLGDAVGDPQLRGQVAEAAMRCPEHLRAVAEHVGGLGQQVVGASQAYTDTDLAGAIGIEGAAR